jgi:hypothetical protein
MLSKKLCQNFANITEFLDTLLEHVLNSLHLLTLIYKAPQIWLPLLLALLRCSELVLFNVWGWLCTLMRGTTRGKQRLYTPIRGMTRGKQRLYTTIRGMIGKTKVEDTCLDPMHVEADEWEIMRGKHTKKLLSSKGNNVNVVELHAGTSARVTTRSEGRKHAIKAQGSGRGPPATPAK